MRKERKGIGEGLRRKERRRIKKKSKKGRKEKENVRMREREGRKEEEE